MLAFVLGICFRKKGCLGICFRKIRGKPRVKYVVFHVAQQT